MSSSPNLEPILTELHSRLFGITAKGNLRLETLGIAAQDANRVGFPGIVGHGLPSQVVITSAASSTANVALVSFQVNDCDGVAINAPVNLDIWLSDSSVGTGLSATSASGTVGIGASGAVFGTYTTKLAFRVQTTSTGLAILSITDTANTKYYPCAQLSTQQGTVVGAQLTTASY
jgi:hypothetical protein